MRIVQGIVQQIVTVLLVAGAAMAASVSITPAQTTAAPGDTFTLGVTIHSVTDLYGWQFDLDFDPMILSALSVTEGNFLRGAGSTFFLAGTIDNAAGTITFNADSLVGSIPGETGDGELAEVQFQAVAGGMSALTLSNLSLLDSNLDPLSADSTDAAVTVDGTMTPEPSTGFYGLCGLGLLAYTGRRRRGWQQALAAAAMAAVPGLASDIPTAQFDSARTNANPAEIYLTTANVNSTKFGKLFTRSVDGDIFAQPLYLQGAVIAGHKVNIVYVVTSHDNVYAFDADNAAAATPIWSVSIGNYETPSGWPSSLGILSTPLMVRATNTLYLTAATVESGTRVYRLHALDLLTGAEKSGSPVVIAGSVTGTAGDALNGVIAFDATKHVQRTGLALAGNNVVMAFAPDRDHPPYHGWVFSYDATSLQQTGLFNDARNNVWDYGTGAGIWQSGRAPAVDAGGSVYFETGNGAFDGALNFGESFLKLTPGSGGLALTDWFTPSAWQALNDVDYDLGSTGPTLIPGTSLVFGGSKSGTVYLLQTGNMGRVVSGDPQIVQQFTATSGCIIPYISQGCAQIMGQVFWSGNATPTMYLWGVHDVLRAYSFSAGQFNTTPVGLGTTSAYYPGGVISMSSYKGVSGTGIVWALTSDAPDNDFYFGPGFTGPATLHAYDANNVSTELWNSNQNVRDGAGVFASFAPPVAVNGKVYVPTFSNQLLVYGLLNGPLPGDVNGDSVVSCADLAIVKASYGKSSSQPGYDLRADVNADGIVNLVDLATVSQKLAAGTICH